ncbi:hypothetical protein DPMN_022656 [Dreissena polymorpha]|uniref:Uncharacterized protein n=1 Tax=Dreissena polymorpha TaxID=45954 RepID=A0A9D4SBY2_DREPO|nr:hypothetical protein DPMN_022656 [Dreissena polymorpha]
MSDVEYFQRFGFEVEEPENIRDRILRDFPELLPQFYSDYYSDYYSDDDDDDDDDDNDLFQDISRTDTRHLYQLLRDFSQGENNKEEEDDTEEEVRLRYP